MRVTSSLEAHGESPDEFMVTYPGWFREEGVRDVFDAGGETATIRNSLVSKG